MVYLLFTSDSGGVSELVVFSATISFINLTASISGDDAKMLKIAFSGKWNNGESQRGQFVALYAFRILEISSKLLLYALLWYCVSGFACTGVLLVDMAAALTMYWTTKQL